MDHSTEFDWRFNKAEFQERARLSGEDEDYDAYARHLDEAAECGERLVERFKRFQALTELHFIEAMIPGVFVPRKMRAITPQPIERSWIEPEES
jgi:hypothetical protein